MLKKNTQLNLPYLGNQFTPLGQKKFKGKFSSFIIKGYGKRAIRSKSLITFKIGLRIQKGVIPRIILPKSVAIKSKKKRTLFKIFTSNTSKQNEWLKEVIELQSRKFPGFAYKDIGIRRFGKLKIKRKKK